MLGFKALNITASIVEQYYTSDTVLSVWHEESFSFAQRCHDSAYFHHSHYTEDETEAPGTLCSLPVSHSQYLAQQKEFTLGGGGGLVARIVSDFCNPIDWRQFSH